MRSPRQVFHDKMEAVISLLQKFTDRWWYAPLIGVLAFLDHFIIIVPTDGLLVSACMLNPKRWIMNALILTLGSALGALILAAAIQNYGLAFALQIIPNLEQMWLWQWTSEFMGTYGSGVLFITAVTPLMQHPAIVLGALAKIPLLQIFTIILLGRAIKYLVFAWIASHTPRLLSKIWGLKGELEEVAEVTRGETAEEFVDEIERKKRYP